MATIQKRDSKTAQSNKLKILPFPGELERIWEDLKDARRRRIEADREIDELWGRYLDESARPFLEGYTNNDSIG